MADWDSFIDKHAQRVGIDPAWMRKIMRVESGGNPNGCTGSYCGLFQLSRQEFKNNGGTGSIFDPEQNTMAAANKLTKEALTFKQQHNREATLQDLYMIHQQGAAGYNAHLANPEGTAWQNVRKYYSSDAIAKKAIWGNMTPSMKAATGSVDNVTSAGFLNSWTVRVTGSPDAVVSRGRPTVNWHRSRGEPEQEPTAPADKPPDKPPQVTFEPFPMPNIHVVAPEAPDIPLRPVQPT